MRWIFVGLFLLIIILFNPSWCFAVRFHPSVSDKDVCELGKKYPSVGMIKEKREIVSTKYPGEILKYDITSTGTLVTVPGLEKHNGSLVLVSGHAFERWKPGSTNFRFIVNGQESKIIDYLSAPEEELSETFLCCWKWRSIPFPRDFGFAFLETSINEINSSPLLFGNFADLNPNDVLTTVGYGDAGRLDSPFCFNDDVRRAMQTYVAECKTFFIDGVSASVDKTPLRLEHFYNWNLESSQNKIIRGSIENSDSGAPVFLGNNVIAIVKSSGMKSNDKGAVLEYTVNKSEIEELKIGNCDVFIDLSTLPFNSISLTMDYLGGASSWISDILPKIIEKKFAVASQIGRNKFKEE
jgi:hypothetical protein